MKVGDKVKLVNLNSPYGGEHNPSTANTIGNTGKISEVVGGNHGWLRVEWENGKANQYIEGNLELLNSFKIGDRVTPVGNSTHLTGEIVGFWENRAIVKVDEKVNIGGWTTEYITWKPENLKLLPPVPPMKIGAFEVSVTDTGVKVGCTPVSDKQILAVAKLRKLI